MKTTYRGFVDFLQGHQGLRHALGMEDKLPHYTTLQKFSTRSNVLAIADALIAQIGTAALKSSGKSRLPVAVAMDATGMETSTASANFVSRSGRERGHPGSGLHSPSVEALVRHNVFNTAIALQKTYHYSY